MREDLEVVLRRHKLLAAGISSGGQNALQKIGEYPKAVRRKGAYFWYFRVEPAMENPKTCVYNMYIYIEYSLIHILDSRWDGFSWTFNHLPTEMHVQGPQFSRCVLKMYLWDPLGK